MQILIMVGKENVIKQNIKNLIINVAQEEGLKKGEEKRRREN